MRAEQPEGELLAECSALIWTVINQRNWLPSRLPSLKGLLWGREMTSSGEGGRSLHTGFCLSPVGPSVGTTSLSPLPCGAQWSPVCTRGPTSSLGALGRVTSPL